MKKFMKLTFILVIIACIAITGNSYAAADLKCDLEIKTDKAEYKPGDEFTADVYVSNIESEEGVLAFSATLEYDKDNLELKKMTGKNSWDSPSKGSSYNEENGAIAITRDSLGKEDEVVFEMEFKVKSNSDTSAKIELKDVTVANGIDNPKEIATAGKDLLIKAASSGSSEDKDKDKDENKTSDNTSTSDRDDTNTNTNKTSNTVTRNVVSSTTTNDNTTKSGIIPKTGDGDSKLWPVIAGMLVVAGAGYFYVKIKIFDNKNRGLRTK